MTKLERRSKRDKLEEKIEAAKKAVGTEFTYVYSDGDTIKAYIKAFDPYIGLTCYSLETVTRDGWEHEIPDDDGTWCVIAFDFKNTPGYTLDRALKWIEYIVENGVFDLNAPERGIGGPISCAF